MLQNQYNYWEDLDLEDFIEHYHLLRQLHTLDSPLGLSDFLLYSADSRPDERSLIRQKKSELNLLMKQISQTPILSSLSPSGKHQPGSGIKGSSFTKKPKNNCHGDDIKKQQQQPRIKDKQKLEVLSYSPRLQRPGLSKPQSAASNKRELNPKKSQASLLSKHSSGPQNIESRCPFPFGLRQPQAHLAIFQTQQKYLFNNISDITSTPQYVQVNQSIAIETPPSPISSSRPRKKSIIECSLLTPIKLHEGQKRGNVGGRECSTQQSMQGHKRMDNYTPMDIQMSSKQIKQILRKARS